MFRFGEALGFGRQLDIIARYNISTGEAGRACVVCPHLFMFRASLLRASWKDEDAPREPSALIISTAVAFLLLLAVVSADVLLGSRFGVLLFYLAPIAWAAWQTGRNISLTVAVFCAFARFGVELVEAYNSGIWRPELIWSITTELIFFMVFVGLILTVQRQLEQERTLARSDGLTRLHNARSFELAVSGERERLRRYGRVMSLVYFDLDNFKSVNDRWGHAAGDELLITVARVLMGNIRQVDVAARLGGDEFALLLPETDAQGASVLLNRLRDKMLAAVQARGWPVTGSFGCVTFLQAPDAVEDVLKAADRAMYKSKHGGKNRIETVIWDETSALEQEMLK
jgi:diguanylate cyclase (GGDEF)-like protein